MHWIGSWLLFLVRLSTAAESIFDFDLSKLSHPPLWEPTIEEYFPQQRNADVETDENGLKSPYVLTSPTKEEFAHHARRGYPMMVSDWGKGMQYSGWSGKDFAEEFPFGWMKAEYIGELKGFKRKDHDIKQIDGELRFKLGSFKPNKKTWWYNFTRPASKRYKDDPLKPVTGPYVWHVKDELTPKEKKLVQARFEAPSFLEDPLNRYKMNESFEIWFSPGEGSGAGAHNDGYCQSVVSLQLVGDKKWRKMLEPDLTILDSYDEFDGGVYLAGKWKPDLGFLNTRDSAVIWPPGYLHETKTRMHPEGKCGAAITLQYDFPQPVQFFRAFLPRLALSAEVGHCMARDWSGYPTFFMKQIKPTPKQAKMDAQLETIMSVLDTDSDGKITVDEAKVFFEKGKSDVMRHMRVGPEHSKLYVQFQAEDTVAYHDKDDDMVVSRQELLDSLAQWNVVRIRMKEGIKLVNKADLQGVKDFEKSLDYMRRAPATFPKKMRPELEHLFSLTKGTKIFPDLRGVNSFSDSEFFSPLQERLHQLGARDEL